MKQRTSPLRRDGRAQHLGVLAFATLLGSLEPACTKSPAANAAIATAANVAAAVAIRAATGSCYAQCAYGTMCDHKSGTCVPIRAEPPPPEEDPCVEECALFAADRVPGEPPPKRPASTCKCPPPRDESPSTDPCAGMCLPGEKCVMHLGELGCE